jgi:hypothetical protein
LGIKHYFCLRKIDATSVPTSYYNTFNLIFQRPSPLFPSKSKIDSSTIPIEKEEEIGNYHYFYCTIPSIIMKIKSVMGHSVDSVSFGCL